MSEVPQSKDKSRASTADEAFAAYKREDYASAAQLYTIAIEEEQLEVEWLVKRCGCYQRLKMDAEAIKDAKTIVKLHPENYKGYAMLGQIYINLKEIKKAVFCFLDSLEVLWLSGLGSLDDKTANACLKNVINANKNFAVLPDNISDQSHLTQLYILGNSLRREMETELALRTFDIALIVQEHDMKMEIDTSSNDNMNMKIHFAHSQCLQTVGRFQEAIDGFKQSLGISMRIGDISYETKACLNLAALCLDQRLFAEAAAFYIRLLAIGEDVKTAVGEDLKFRDHWSVEMESSILLNLCIAFKSLRLYSEALNYAKKYDVLVCTENILTPTPTPAPHIHPLPSRSQSVPLTRSYSRSFLTKSIDTSGILQAKFILGDLYELTGHLDTAMSYYISWYNLSQQLVASSSAAVGEPYLLDSASALSCKGNIHMKQEQYQEALECFTEQAKICRSAKALALHMEALMSQGDALVKLDKIEDARSKFQDALKMSRKIVDDLVPECFCMWKIASVFAAEHRYTHAAYYCEKATDLAIKSGNKAMIKKLEYELTLYYQHSTSQNELFKASRILHRMILFQEDNIYRHLSNGGKHLIEEEDMLISCYVAMQLVMYKLGEQTLSIAFGECLRMRKINKLKSAVPQIPKLPDNFATDKEFVKESDDTSSNASSLNFVKVINASNALEKTVLGGSIVITYTLLDSGFLVHITRPGLGIVKSYYSADHDVEPFATRGQIKELIAVVTGNSVSNIQKLSKDLSNIYNTENRCLPKTEKCAAIKMPKIPSKSTVTKPKENQTPPDDVMAAGEGVFVTSQKPVITEISKEQNEVKDDFTSACRKLYCILISPVDDVLADVAQGSNIVFIPHEELYSIPFGALINPESNELLGQRYKITICPCLELMKSERKDGIPGDKNSEISSQLREAANTSDFDKDEEKIFREKELMKSFQTKDAVKSLDLSGLSKGFTKLVTKTATGTNVIVSPRYVAPFHQTHKVQKATVIGCPTLPQAVKYKGDLWEPKNKIPLALKECKKISEYCECDCLIGDKATKKAFLNELFSSTLLHIATYAHLCQGLLAFSPDGFPAQKSNPEEISYLVTPNDILSMDCSAVKLVVLSCGYSSIKNVQPDNFVYLASCLLSAGVTCVLHQLWAVPNHIVDLFHFHLYKKLQTGSLLSVAVSEAKEAVKSKYKDPCYWSAFELLGSDTEINLSNIRTSQLHSKLNALEDKTLNIPDPVDEVISMEGAYEILQSRIASLSGYLSGCAYETSVIGLLIELLEESMDRLTVDSNTNRPVITLPVLLAQQKDALDVLQLLGFAFQPSDLETPTSRHVNPAVLFPHWNKDGLLLPTHQALTGLQDICTNSSALQSLARSLPLPQEKICAIIDLLAVTRHTPEVQLSIHDVGVASLWADTNIRAYLEAIGFVTVHSLLVFFKTSTNRTLLIASLQFFASLCLHRDQSVLEQLNIITLGRMPTAIKRDNLAGIPSLKPVQLPRKEVLLTGSWMKNKVDSSEKMERKKLAEKIYRVKSKYDQALQHAKWWHNNMLTPQAEIKLSQFGAPVKEKPLKRKVLPGATPSCQRISVDSPSEEDVYNQQRETLMDAMQKRDYVHFVAAQSYKEINSRLQADVNDLYKQYTTTQQD